MTSSSPISMYSMVRKGGQASHTRALASRVGSVTIWLVAVSLALLGLSVNAAPVNAAEIGSGWTRPIDSPSVLAGWLASGCSGNSGYLADRYHIGIDLGAPVGTTVRSLGSGRVIRVWRDGSWGVTNGVNNAGIWVQYAAADGSQFVAVYGHVVPAAGTDNGPVRRLPRSGFRPTGRCRIFTWVSGPGPRFPRRTGG